MSAGAFRKAQAVAGVAGRPRRKVLNAGRRMRKHLLAPFDVMRKAAAGEHDAPFCANAHIAAFARYDRAGDRAVLDRQLADRRGQPHRNFQVLRGFGKAPGQRIAVGQRHAAAVAQHIHQMPRQALGDVDRRGQRLRHAHEVDDLLAGAEHHAEHGQLGQRHAQCFDLIAELAAVERARDHGAAALRAAGRFSVVVGKHQRHVEAQRGLGGEEVDGLGASAQERIDTRGIKIVAGFVPQIIARLLLRLYDAVGFGQRGAGNPQPAAGAGGGAAEARLLLDDQHVEAAIARGDRRRHAGATRSGHEHIALVGFACAALVAGHVSPHFFKSGHLDSETGRKASSPFTVLMISR